MNFNQHHKFYCGVDLHARTMFVRIVDGACQSGTQQAEP
jgi:hypothetical protein